MRSQADYADIRNALSIRRLAKFGAIPPDGPEGREQWLKQMDVVAQEAGLPNVYRTHPYRSQKREAA